MNILSFFGPADDEAESTTDLEIYEGEQIDEQIFSADERKDTIVIQGSWHNRCSHMRTDENLSPLEQGPVNKENKLPWWRR